MSTIARQSIEPTVKPDLNRLFMPASIAHVGASPNRVPGRFTFIEYLNRMGFRGALYPVNPKYDEVFGHRCYPSLTDIPGEVDLVILALPAASCAPILRDVPASKIKFVVVHTSGFSEIGKPHLEEELLDLARQKGFRIIGPNCMGIFSEAGRVCFWNDHQEYVGRQGTVGYVSQSGGLTIQLITGCIDLGVNMAKAVSLGNQIDLSIEELLEYYGDDDSIETIAVYIEGVKDGRKFLEVLGRITPKKPVLVWKGGRTEVGSAAAHTHTGSMAGDAAIFEAAMRQAGAIMGDNLEMMVRLLRLLKPPRSLPGRRLVVVSPGGGTSVNVSDAFGCCRHISLPRLSDETRARIQKLLPEENVDTKNPVDPGAVGMTRLDRILRTIGEDPDIDSIMLMLSDEIPFHFENEIARKTITDGITSLTAAMAKVIKKPIYAHLMHIRDNNEDVYHCRKLMADGLISKGVPWTDGSFEDAARALDKVAGYGEFLRRRS